MEVTSSAPGKLMLLGEYAVLRGAPALVMAIDRRARVRLEPAAGYSVSAPHMGTAPAAFKVDPNGVPVWASAEAAERFRLLDHLLRERRGKNGLAPFRVVLDTNPFFQRSRDGATKLGLGSSAALTAALFGALTVYSGGILPEGGQAFTRLLHTHRGLQGGQGSGFDLAAALHGGTLGFRLEGGEAEITPIALPDGLHTLCVWSGNSAATGNLVRRVETWREAEPQAGQALFEVMSETALAGVDAARQGDNAALLAAIERYADLLVALGDASGADIVCGGHRRIRRLANDAGAVYKPCGAGGGDVGVVFSDNAGCIGHLRGHLEYEGFVIIPLREDKGGLHVETKE